MLGLASSEGLGGTCALVNFSALANTKDTSCAELHNSVATAMSYVDENLLFLKVTTIPNVNRRATVR